MSYTLFYLQQNLFLSCGNKQNKGISYYKSFLKFMVLNVG